MKKLLAICIVLGIFSIGFVSASQIEDQTIGIDDSGIDETGETYVPDNANHYLIEPIAKHGIGTGMTLVHTFCELFDI